MASFQGPLRAGLAVRLTLCPLTKFIWELKRAILEAAGSRFEKPVESSDEELVFN